MNVASAGKSSLGCQTSLCTTEAIRERSPMNVMNVGKSSLRSHTSLCITGLIQERSRMNVMSVGKNSTTGRPSTAIREFIGEGTWIYLTWEVSSEVSSHSRKPSAHNGCGKSSWESDTTVWEFLFLNKEKRLGIGLILTWIFTKDQSLKTQEARLSATHWTTRQFIQE